MVLAILSAALLSADPLGAPWRAEAFSVSDPRGVLSLDANPAGLATTQEWELSVEGSREGPQRRSAIFASTGSLGFGWASSPEADRVLFEGDSAVLRKARAQSWIVGLGLPLPGGFDFGWTARYRHVGEASTGWSNDLGAIWRPVRFLSLGWDWRDVGEQDGQRWSGHGIAVGVRPFGTPVIALGWEGWKGGVPDLEARSTDGGIVHEFHGEIRPWDWLAFTGRWVPRRSAEVWSLGVSAQLSPHVRFFSGNQPGEEGGNLQSVGLHMGGDLLPDVGLGLPGYVVYHVGALSGEAGTEGIVLSRKGFAQVRDDLLRLAERSDVKAVVLDLGYGKLTMSHAGALRRLVLKLRQRGKTVSAWSQDLTMSSLHVMSACSKSAISPLGTVRSRGLSMRSIYMGSALRKHGIDVELVRTGPWKSAMEPFVSDRMSEEAREDQLMHLHDLDSMILGGIALERGIDPSKLIAWIDSGSMLPAKAVEARIVDTLLEPQDVASWGSKGLVPVPQPRAEVARTQWGRTRSIAVVSLEGQIVDGKGHNGMVPWGRNLEADAVVDVLRNLRNDPRIAGVVLRVNSPGGSVVGSERIRRAVAELERKKPVAASFGGVAASGAYLFSLPARRIWTEPEAIVGSIGVFTARVSAARLLDSLGLHVETVSTGPGAGSSSPLARIDSFSTARLGEQVESAYAMFADLVKKARHLDSASFSRVDGGRVFTGARASGNGLADSLGGLEDAIAWTAAQAGLPRHADVEWFVPGTGRWDAMLSRLDAGVSARPWDKYEALLSAPSTSVWAQLPWEIEGP